MRWRHVLAVVHFGDRTIQRQGSTSCLLAPQEFYHEFARICPVGVGKMWVKYKWLNWVGCTNSLLINFYMYVHTYINMDSKTNQSLHSFLRMRAQGKNMNGILMYYNAMLVPYLCFCLVSRKTTNIIVKKKCLF